MFVILLHLCVSCTALRHWFPSISRPKTISHVGLSVQGWTLPAVPGVWYPWEDVSGSYHPRSTVARVFSNVAATSEGCHSRWDKHSRQSSHRTQHSLSQQAVQQHKFWGTGPAAWRSTCKGTCVGCWGGWWNDWFDGNWMDGEMIRDHPFYESFVNKQCFSCDPPTLYLKWTNSIWPLFLRLHCWVNINTLINAYFAFVVPSMYQVVAVCVHQHWAARQLKLTTVALAALQAV